VNRAKRSVSELAANESSKENEDIVGRVDGMEMVEEGLEVVKPRSDWKKESVVSI
jgi:hypothetical protein